MADSPAVWWCRVDKRNFKCSDGKLRVFFTTLKVKNHRIFSAITLELAYVGTWINSIECF